MKKILSVVGARPNFIKLASLQPFLEKSFDHVIIHTGQHYDYDLSGGFFAELAIPKPDYNLKVGSGERIQQIKKIRERCVKIIRKEKPVCVLIYGDTNSSLGGAEAAKAAKVPVAHIEAGVRSFDKSMPEELNRVAIDRISNILFCPTKASTENLKQEKITKNIFTVGDTMYDVFLKTKLDTQIIKKIGLKPKKYYFATIHRQANTNSSTRLKRLFLAFTKLKQIVVIPMHPRTKKALSKIKIDLANVYPIDPVTFKESITLQKNSLMVLTDSGGIQKEAYYSKVPCLTLRSNTEWPETVKSGWNTLVDTNVKKIVYFTQKFIRPQKHPPYFGEGNAAEKISRVLNQLYYGS